MIDSSKLRVGNLFLNKEYSHSDPTNKNYNRLDLLEVENFYFGSRSDSKLVVNINPTQFYDSIEINGTDIDDLIPIKLTDSILNSLLEPGYHSGWYIGRSVYLELYSNGEYFTCFVKCFCNESSDNEEIGGVTYLHELQNFYHAINGDDLDISKIDLTYLENKIFKIS